MGYPSPGESTPIFDRLSEVTTPDTRLRALYSMSVRIHEGEHACAYLTRLDLQTHLLTSESYGCYGSARPTRLGALYIMANAVTEAIRDAASGGR